MTQERRASSAGRRTSTAGGGLFHRKERDKRLVKQVTTLAHQPTHWTPMDVQEVECKLMEIRRYSADFYDVDTRFRKPNLELITAYAVQNPFLYGMFSLRKEQMKQQLANLSTVTQVRWLMGELTVNIIAKSRRKSTR